MLLESPPPSPETMLRLPEFGCQPSGISGLRIGKPSSRESYLKAASASKLGTGPGFGPPGLNEH